MEDNLNLFGEGFDDVSEVWSLLCAADTDNDGFSNGVELGDPGCTYTPGASIGPPLSDPLNAASTPANPGFLGPPYPPDLIVAHGAMMIIAWAVFAPVGIALATVLKKGKSPLWFKAHRALLMLALVFTLVAFFMVVFTKEGGGEEDGYPPRFSSPHTSAGFAVVLLGCLQAVSGALRPENGKTKTDTRLGWEFAHQWLGRIVVIVAFYAIWTGLEMGFAVSSDAAEGEFSSVLGSNRVVFNRCFLAGKIMFGVLFGVAGLFLIYVIVVRDAGVRMPWAQPEGSSGGELKTTA